MTKMALGLPNVWGVIFKKFTFLLNIIIFLLLSASAVHAQNKTVRGKIMDSVGRSLPGVTVSVKGTKTATSTNGAGEFILNGMVDRPTLVISNIGLKTQEIRLAAGQTSVSVSMLTDITNLQDVVVTGFQRIDRKKFTGAAVTLKAEDIKIDGVVDVSRLLEGRAAGVSVQNVSSTFGSAPKVRVRGATSINGENKPLWVVDGVVLEDIVNISNDQLSSGDPTTLLGSSVAGINANDIESFDILKDAAATALYGARAMNGVVVITTKKGKAGKLVINYSGNFSTQLKPNYNEYNIMNSAQQMSVLSELDRKGALTTNILGTGNYGVYGKYYDEVNKFTVLNTPEAKKAFLLRYATANTNWFDILFKQSLIQEHSLSISSGTDKSQSFFSTSFYNDNGWTKADNVKRYTLNFRNNYSFSDRLTAGFITTASFRQQHAPGTVNRTPNVVTGAFDRDFDINPFSYALNTSRVITAYDTAGKRETFVRNFAPFNILTELENNKLNINVIDLKLQGELGYKFTKHLRYDFIGALRYVRSTREQEVTENSNMANAYRAAGNATIRENNPFLYRDPDNLSGEKQIVLPSGGFYNRVEDQLLNFDIRNSLNYVNTFGEKHNINLLVGQQIKLSDRQNASNTGYGYQYDNGGVASPDFRIIKQSIESNFPYFGMSKDFDRFAAFYFNAQYTYNKKYNFYGTVRYDGSNRLGSSKTARWLPTWSFGGSWNIDEENFMQNLKAVSYLKLRASYGLTASLGPATNSNIVLRNINIHRPYLTDAETIITIANLANTELTWEKNFTTNVGIDAGLFGNKINVSVDVYQRRSFDLISIIKTSGIGGEAKKAANYADMKAQGAELLIGGQVFKAGKFGWKTNLTFGYNTTKITNAKNQPQIFDLIKAEGGNLVGYPVNSLFSIKFAGLNHLSGVPEFIDESGKKNSGVYLQSDSISNLKFEGSIDPKFTGGFSNTFSYQAFSLNVFFTYQAGNKIRLYPAFKNEYTELDATPREFYNRWVIPSDEQHTNIPSIMDAYQNALTGRSSFNFPYNNYNYSTVRVASGDFIRLKTVSLTYQFPVSFLEKTSFLKNLSFTAAAINPWLIYADKKLQGQDPEFFNAGGVAQPIQKQVTLSIRAGL